MDKAASESEAPVDVREVAHAQSKVRAWVAAAAIDHHGKRCVDPERSALTLVAVSVHEACAPKVEARVKLMLDVARTVRMPVGMRSLWVYPAGYFGFDAAAYSSGNKAAAWPGVDPGVVEDRLSEIVEAHPVGSSIAFGVDSSARQEAWLVHSERPGSGTAPKLCRILRDKTSLAERSFDLDGQGLKAAFLVCSEIAGYEGQLSDNRLIVDLAHVRVPGTVWCDRIGARMVHQRVLASVALHGAAVLAHHHAGQITKTEGGHFRHQSNWILFRGNGADWLDPTEVEVVP